MHHLFSNHMVMQQDTTVEIWDRATKGKTVAIRTTWGEKAQTRADEKGKWKMELNTPTAGETYQLTVSTRDTTITVSDILLGEVWLCGGQSNMNMPMGGFGASMAVENHEAEMAAATYPEIRQFLVRNVKQIHEQERVKGEWKICNPENVKDFTAVGSYFGKALYEKLGVPVGLIKSSPELRSYAENITGIRQSETVLASWLQGVDVEKFTFQNKAEVLEHTEKNSAEIAEGEVPAHAASIRLPVVLEESGVPFLNYFNGIIWLIKEVEIPQHWESQNLMLTLGRIVDHDRVFFNGKIIGETQTGSLYKINRKYNVDDSLVKAGRNRIAIQLFDWSGEAGYTSGADAMNLFPENYPEKAITLAGEWDVFLQAEIFDQTLFDYSDADFNYIKGAIFYQGEANSRWNQGAKLYHEIFPAMVADWRTKWGADFPFYHVQIAPFDYGRATNASFLRDVQRKSMATIQKSGMVSILDVGDPGDIHPSHKDKVGERLALWALTHTYGKDVGEYSGPLPGNLSKKRSTLILQFYHAKNGLIVKETTQNEFEIAGADGKFVPANIEVNGEMLIASSPEITDPLQLRYAWRNAPEAALFNREDLPASSFCTGLYADD